MFDLGRFLSSYPWYAVILEMAVIWVFVYMAFRFLRGTRGAGAIKGFTMLLVVVSLVILLLGRGSDAFGRLTYIYQKFLSFLAIVLIVVFQPELRQAMIRLGHARFFRSSRGRVSQVVDAVSEAAEFLSKSRFGALIAIERSSKLGGLVEGGQAIDAQVSPRLLLSIFWPNNPLHDLGVVIRDDRILAANVQFPLVEEGSLPPQLGSRHRAAVGLSVESDCLIVIVSEETGRISLAERGKLETVPRDKLRIVLAERLEAVLPEPGDGEATPEIVATTDAADDQPAPPVKDSELEVKAGQAEGPGTALKKRGPKSLRKKTSVPSQETGVS